MKALFLGLIACLFLGMTMPVLAAPKNKPDYVTRAEVQAIVEAEIAARNLVTIDQVQALIDAEIAKLDLLTAGQVQVMINTAVGNIPKPAKPSFDLVIINNETGVTVTGKFIRISCIASTELQIKPNPWYPTPVWCEPLARVQYWGVLHTPDGDINSQVRYEGNEIGIMIFETANEYHSQILTADIYAFYGGKIASKTISIICN